MECREKLTLEGMGVRDQSESHTQDEGNQESGGERLIRMVGFWEERGSREQPGSAKNTEE